jgi:hypothetical protein
MFDASCHACSDIGLVTLMVVLMVALVIVADFQSSMNEGMEVLF